MPEETFYVEGIQIAKRGIAMDIQKFVPELSETKFVETFKAEPKPVVATPTPAPAATTTETEPKQGAKAAPEAKPAKAPKATKAAKP
jgi:hypothetical protein